MMREEMSPCRFKLKTKFDREARGRAIARLPKPVTAVAKCERPCAQRMEPQALPKDNVATARQTIGIISPNNRCSVKSFVNHIGITGRKTASDDDMIIEIATPKSSDFSEEYFACSGKPDPKRCAHRTFDASETAMTISSAKSHSSPTRPQMATSAGPCIAANTKRIFHSQFSITRPEDRRRLAFHKDFTVRQSLNGFILISFQ